MIKKLGITLIFFIICLPSLVYSEYRVFQYSIKNKITSAIDQPNSNIVLSTLNPVSYLAYNGGGSLMTVDLLRTWICPGHTGNKKDICPSPYDKIVERLIE